MRRFWIPAVLVCMAAQAQEPDILRLEAADGSPNRPSQWRVSLGGMVLGLPTYPGSGEGRVVPLPVFNAEYGDRLYLGASRVSVGFGGGMHLVRTRHLLWDFGLGLGEARRESRADTLAGMGDRSASLWAGTGLHLRQGPFRVGLTAAVGLRESSGARATLSFGVAGSPAPRWLGGVGVSGTVSSAKNMAYAFGVTPAQAAERTRLLAIGDARLRPGEDRPYAPGGGAQEIALNAHLAYLVDARWRIFGILRAARLQDLAEQSPLVRENGDGAVGLGCSYRF